MKVKAKRKVEASASNVILMIVLHSSAGLLESQNAKFDVGALGLSAPDWHPRVWHPGPRPSGTALTDKGRPGLNTSVSGFGTSRSRDP